MDILGNGPKVLPPKGYRELTEDEARRNVDFNLRLELAGERVARVEAEIRAARSALEAGQYRLRDSKGILHRVSSEVLEWTRGMGSVDGDKEFMVSVEGKVFVRDARRNGEAAAVAVPEPEPSRAS